MQHRESEPYLLPASWPSKAPMLQSGASRVQSVTARSASNSPPSLSSWHCAKESAEAQRPAWGAARLLDDQDLTHVLVSHSLWPDHCRPNKGPRWAEGVGQRTPMKSPGGGANAPVMGLRHCSEPRKHQCLAFLGPGEIGDFPMSPNQHSDSGPL